MGATRDPVTGQFVPGPGVPHSPEHRARISAAQKGIPNPTRGQVGDEHWEWKGDDVSYFVLHKWVRRHKGPASAQLCVECGNPAEEWANISGEYHRDLEDYQPMCRKCHRRRDRGGGSRYDSTTKSLRAREKEVVT